MRAPACLFAFGLLLAPTTAHAEDKIYVVPLGELTFDEGQDGLAEALARPASNRWAAWVGRQAEGGIGVRVPEPVEAYLAHPQPPGDGPRFDPQGRMRLALRVSKDEPVRGFCDLSGPGAGREPFAFAFDPSKYTTATQDEFDAVRSSSYRALADARLPGSPWFKHLADAPAENPTPRRRRVENELSPTFSAFSGGRAIAENLALDRELIIGREEGDEMVAIADIEGITVPEIDWTARMPNEEIAIDPLAKFLPLDQHALFFPKVEAFAELLRLLEAEAAPVLQNYDVRSPFQNLPARYLAQLGLGDREALANLPVESVALTGGDPFLPSGSDIALLFETGKAPALFEQLAGKIEAAAKQNRASPVEFTVEGGQHRGFRNSSRDLSAHLLRLGDLVAVTNSEVQLERLVAVATGAAPSLGGTDEFAFFRHRYPLAHEGELGFLFLSDAAIRRWCGPEMRIGASRRARGIAALGELTARELTGGEIGDTFAPLLGEVSVGGDKSITSEHFGSLAFMTPVSELKIEQVTASEKTGYENWRRGYQSGWRRVFDPIAVRLTADDSGHEIDLSVIPLTLDTRYREWIQLAGDSSLSAGARHAHEETVMFMSFAIDSDSEAFLRSDRQLSDMLPGLKINPLSWVGESVSVYFERDFFWRALAESDNEGSSFLTTNVGQLPIGIRVESRSNIKLAMFLTGLRGLSEASAPGLLRWEKRQHGEQPYIAIISEGGLGTDLSLYYATVPGALLLSLNESILKRAIDREATMKNLDDEALPSARHAMMRALPEVFDRADGLMQGRSLIEAQRSQSWRALPVLNEWRRRHPGTDPAGQHLATFGAPLHCPGGKGYRWNAEAMTMESIAFGHPAAPREDAGGAGFAAHFGALTAGISFEDDGLRMRASLAKPAPDLAQQVPPEGKLLALAKDLMPYRTGTIRRYEAQGEDAPFESVAFEVLEPGEHAGSPTTRVRAKETNDDGTVTESALEQMRTEAGMFVLSRHSRNLRQDYSDPMIELPARLIAGHTQRFDFRGTVQFEGEGEDESDSLYGEIAVTPVALETVTVPAGQLENCIRVEFASRIVSDSRISGGDQTAWYHPDVGMVQQLAGIAREQKLVLVEATDPPE